ncbi:hypothetical protein J7L00_04115 [Candidatus Bathyarchaeota archaeon]|nr:hypothetical protein [Candidatus Bathyarchaeota archaeon]
MASQDFERDINRIVDKLCEGEEIYVSKEIKRLGESLISLHKRNLVKINHSVMELVCAKHLILDGYYVEVEKILNKLSCDIYARKGLGALIVEVETGYIPPEHALRPLTYLRARIASKITRYSGYAEKFGLAVPPHYAMIIPPAFLKPPRDRMKEEIADIKALCDLYYSNPPVSFEEIRNARIHTVYILDVEGGAVKETEPSTYMEMVSHMFYEIKDLKTLAFPKSLRTSRG